MAAPTLPQVLRSRDSDRRRRYAANLAFYNGDQWPTPSNQLRRSGQRRLTLNYTQAFINKTTSYLMNGIQYVAYPERDDQTSIDRAAETERIFRQLADENELDVMEFETELDCAVLGDAAYKVTWDPAAARVRIGSPDVANLFTWSRPDDTRDLWRVAQRYTLPAADAARLYNVSSARATAEIVEEWTDDTLTLWVNGDAQPTAANPYGFIPYVIFPNIRKPKDLWGTSDIEAIAEPARELNRATTQLSLIMELSGNPITVLENVNESTDIAVQPGAVWELPADAKAYLLDLLERGGPRVGLDYLDTIRRMMHDLGESPPAAFGDNAQGLSGVALNVQLDPLVKKVERKRLIRGRALTRRNAMAMQLLAQFGGISPELATHPLTVQWGELLPNDRSQDVADEVALVGAAIHTRRRAATVTGVADPDAEFERWTQEAEEVLRVQPKQTPQPARQAGAGST